MVGKGEQVGLMMAKLAEQLILGLDVASTRRRRGQDRTSVLPPGNGQG